MIQGFTVMHSCPAKAHMISRRRSCSSSLHDGSLALLLPMRLSLLWKSSSGNPVQQLQGRWKPPQLHTCTQPIPQQQQLLHPLSNTYLSVRATSLSILLRRSLHLPQRRACSGPTAAHWPCSSAYCCCCCSRCCCRCWVVLPGGNTPSRNFQASRRADGSMPAVLQ
jgi:hypothetical protein